MTNALVSIIIPIYNSEQYLTECILSVINQTYKNIEIICVNDGSIDNSVNILTSLVKKYPQIKLLNQNNCGAASARNKGFLLSKGDYIKFFDSDDIMNPEHIERQLKAIENKYYNLASCEWGRLYNDKIENVKFIPESVWQDLPSIEWIRTALKQSSDMASSWLWLIPRNIILKAGLWDERLTLNDDFEFSIRLLLSAKAVSFAKGAKIYYRSGLNNSLGNSNTEKAYMSGILATKLGCSHILMVENSIQMKLLCANRFQELAFRIYPKYKTLINIIEQNILELGGSNNKLNGGKILKLLCKLFGWKNAKLLQQISYKFGYTKRKL